jgi:hypothetical protein
MQNQVIWMIFWQKCINEKVLKLRHFTPRARERYQLEDIQSEISLGDHLNKAKEAVKLRGKQKVTTSGSHAAGGTASQGGGQRVSRRGTVSLGFRGSMIILTE